MDADNFFKNQTKPQLPEGKEFLVWLSHDVDRVHKSVAHSVYYWLKDRRFYHLRTVISRNDPYWNFERIIELESKYGAKSTFFFLNESMKPDLAKPKSFILSKGRYNINDPKIVSVIREIDRNGWEIGLHGSYNSYCEKVLLLREKNVLEGILGHPVYGVRQHYWNNSIPQTWEFQRAAGLKYDATVVMKNDVGFYKNVYYPFRPFDDDFIVIPTVVMDGYLLNKAKDRKTGEKIINGLIDLCREKRTILSALWHQKVLNPSETPLLYDLYVYLLDSVRGRGGEFVLPQQIV